MFETRQRKIDYRSTVPVLTVTTVPGVTRRRAIAIAYGVVCHTFFAVAVGAMIAAMYFGMSYSLGRAPQPWNVLANAILLAQFPLAHSLLLSSFGMRFLKGLAPTPIGEPMATTTYVIVASVQVFLLFALWTPSGIVWWRAGGVWLWLQTGFYTVAWLLLLKAIVDAGLALQTGFLGWWSVARNRPPVFPPMPTAGLFRIVRQPIYVAFALTLWTVPTWTPDQLTVAVVLTGYCLIGPLFKERRFRQRFGQAFVAYAREVPYWLPRPSSVERNDLSIYDAPADWWDGKTRWLRTLQNLAPARFAFFDPIVGDWRGKSVLDLGCGAGFMAAALAERGAIVTGVDPSKGAIDSALRHARTNHLVIDYRVGSGELLPFADGVYDVVVCVDVLEHVEDLGQVLLEVRRVLRPGGMFLFDTINRTWSASFVMVTIAENIIGLLPRGAHDPARFIRPKDLVRKLEAVGLSAGRFAGLGPRGLNRRLDFEFGFLPTLAVQYLGEARVAGDNETRAGLAPERG
jgi:ubiquinone biosynthesis O-methyltransferase